MVLSMTGFGRSESTFQGKKIVVEIKSLNSKSLDLNTKVPIRYKEREFEIRKILGDKIVRGKVDCYINIETIEDNHDVKINKELVAAYIQELKSISADGPDFEYLKMAIRFPEAISTKPDELKEEEWEFLLNLIEESLNKFIDFRKTEGATLHLELAKNIENIDNALQEIIPYEQIRLESVKERYKKTLNEFDNIDETRFYQELAYYTEKLDISEEKVRLSQHLSYYTDVLSTEDFCGKKLGFIAQEIGREINTLGSKANHAAIQKLVVMMKDELEKIKEQTLNIL
ncbi:MAG: YicC family protein [Bacteroidetes bacterium]|jgi:uncharacterized protein (TIGR00255 family)|nr:YicC family protein [Bacteroidota bacterium]